MEVTVFAFIRDEGSVLVFGATRFDGQDVYIGVDHRMGEPIAQALDYECPTVEVEPWQVIGKVPAPCGLTFVRNATTITNGGD